MHHRNSTLAMSESRYGHQARAWLGLSLVGYFVIPKIDVVDWTSPLSYLLIVLSVICIVGILGYPAFWAVKLCQRFPLTSSVVMIGSGFIALLHGTNPASTATFAPHLVLFLVLIGVPGARFLLWATGPKQNRHLELAHENR